MSTATTEYTTEQELNEFVNRVMALETFSHLREDEINVMPCFCVKLDEDGEPVDYKLPPVKLKKVDDLNRAFMPDKPHYLLVMDYGYWKDHPNDPDAQCERYVFEALCSISIEHGDNGELKLKHVAPDVKTYAKAMQYYGPNLQPLLAVADFFDVRNAMRNHPERLLPRSAAAANTALEPEAEEPEAEPVPVRVKARRRLPAAAGE